MCSEFFADIQRDDGFCGERVHEDELFGKKGVLAEVLVKSQVVKRPHGVRSQLQSRADLGEVLRFLDDVGVNSGLRCGEGGGQSSDTAADNQQWNSTRARLDFQQSGINVRQQTFPIVRMDWVEGDTLGIWLDKHFGDARALEKARTDFAAIARFLEQKGIAHGDIQNGNVMVANGDIKLIDYDGMFVPGMRPGNGSETGHKHFQHPHRRVSDFGPKMDRFSFIANRPFWLLLRERTTGAPLFIGYVATPQG